MNKRSIFSWILRIIGLLFVASILLIIIFMPRSQADTSVVVPEISEVYTLINEERAKAGVPPVITNGLLTKAAEAKASDMLARDYWSHNAPDGTEPWTFIKDAGYKYSEAGENLAKDYSSASQTVSAWVSSPGHYANLIRDSFEEVGIGIVVGTLGDKQAIIIVSLYARPS